MCDGRTTNLYLIKGILLSVLIFFSFACLSSSDNEIEQLQKQIDLQQNEINELKLNSNPPKDDEVKSVNSVSSSISVPIPSSVIPQVSESTSTALIPSLTVPLPGAVMPAVPLPIPCLLYTSPSPRH